MPRLAILQLRDSTALYGVDIESRDAYTGDLETRRVHPVGKKAHEKKVWRKYQQGYHHIGFADLTEGEIGDIVQIWIGHQNLFGPYANFL